MRRHFFDIETTNTDQGAHPEISTVELIEDCAASLVARRKGMGLSRSERKSFPSARLVCRLDILVEIEQVRRVVALLECR